MIVAFAILLRGVFAMTAMTKNRLSSIPCLECRFEIQSLTLYGFLNAGLEETNCN